MTDAHEQKVTHRYLIHYPEHEPREDDPHYVDFDHYRRNNIATAVCEFARRRNGDTSECAGGFELHHHHVEFALLNGVDLVLLEPDYPGISDRERAGEWLNSADNLVFYCAKHHRGHGGVHNASASDFEASHYVRNLIG